nr:hypothetical protein [Tanacetum cinerariifolium]
MRFARALLEVDADRNLKEEVVMAVPRLEVEIPKEPIEASDGFTMVQNRRKKGKNVANGVPKVNEDENITHHTNASDASTGDVQAENGATNVVDDDSEVEDLGNEYKWTVIGDFSVALNIEDNLTRGSAMTSAMCEFKDYVEQIKVQDINSFGLQYTWNQKPKRKGGILKKLNRVMGNLEFIDAFPGTYKMKMLKKPLHKLLHSHGNLHDRVNKLRVELEAVQKVLDQ